MPSKNNKNMYFREKIVVYLHTLSDAQLLKKLIWPSQMLLLKWRQSLSDVNNSPVRFFSAQVGESAENQLIYIEVFAYDLCMFTVSES